MISGLALRKVLLSRRLRQLCSRAATCWLCGSTAAIVGPAAQIEGLVVLFNPTSGTLYLAGPLLMEETHCS